MTKHTVNSVLRPSLAKVQPSYRGKYPSRVRTVGASTKCGVHITSNDYRVLACSILEAKGAWGVVADSMDFMHANIDTLAQQLAEYRNSTQAGRTTGPVARRIMADINRVCGGIYSSDDMLRDAEQHYAYVVVLVHRSEALAHKLGTMSELTAKYDKMRSRAWEAAKSDARVTVCQVYNLTGYDMYKAKPVKAGAIAREVMRQINDSSELSPERMRYRLRRVIAAPQSFVSLKVAREELASEKWVWAELPKCAKRVQATFGLPMADYTVIVSDKPVKAGPIARSVAHTINFALSRNDDQLQGCEWLYAQDIAFALASWFHLSRDQSYANATRAIAAQRADEAVKIDRASRVAIMDQVTMSEFKARTDCNAPQADREWLSWESQLATGRTYSDAKLLECARNMLRGARDIDKLEWLQSNSTYAAIDERVQLLVKKGVI